MPDQVRSRVAIVGGFLGAGKTSALIESSRRLRESGRRVAVILNDQAGDLIDTELLRATDVAVGEVTGGCFCCRFEDLVSTISDLVARHRPDIVLAEAVGSCTDVQATVVLPLQAMHSELVEVAPLTVMVDAARYDDLLGSGAAQDAGTRKLAYLMDRQLAEAEVIALNKVDLLPDGEEAERALAIQARYGDARVLPMSAATGSGVDGLLAVWSGTTASGRPVEVDYDVYADAEAALAWLNATATSRGRGFGGFSPREWVGRFTADLERELRERRLVIGHVKVQMQTGTGATTVSLVRTGDPVAFRTGEERVSGEASLLVNARVMTGVAEMEGIVRAALASTDEALGTRTEVRSWQCFSPARPVPTHRISAPA